MKSTETVIDLISIYGKTKIEQAAMSESQKEFSKFGIDVGKELLKELAKIPKKNTH